MMEEPLLEVAKEKDQTRPEMGSSFVRARKTSCWETAPGSYMSMVAPPPPHVGLLRRAPEEVCIIGLGFRNEIFFIISITSA